MQTTLHPSSIQVTTTIKAAPTTLPTITSSITTTREEHTPPSHIAITPTPTASIQTPTANSIPTAAIITTTSSVPITSSAKAAPTTVIAIGPTSSIETKSKGNVAFSTVSATPTATIQNTGAESTPTAFVAITSSPTTNTGLVIGIVTAALVSLVFGAILATITAMYIKKSRSSRDMQKEGPEFGGTLSNAVESQADEVVYEEIPEPGVHASNVIGMVQNEAYGTAIAPSTSGDRTSEPRVNASNAENAIGMVENEAYGTAITSTFSGDNTTMTKNNAYGIYYN